MVDVAGAADGEVVGEELEGDDFEQGEEQLGGLRDVDDVFDQLAMVVPPSITIAITRSGRADTDPYSVRFTDRHKWVVQLPGFVGEPAKSTEGILEAIQTAWHEEYEDAKG